MKKCGFTILEVLISLMLASLSCQIAYTAIAYTTKQRSNINKYEEALPLCREVLNSFKLLGSSRIRDIYEKSPKSYDGNASWYFRFNSIEEIYTAVSGIYYFEGCIESITDRLMEKNEGYIAYLTISMNSDDTDNYKAYPLTIYLVNKKGELLVKLNYEFYTEI